MQSSESNIVLDANNMVISKSFVCAVRYYYDAEDGLVKKHIKFADGTEHTANYEQTENDSQIVKFTAGGKTVASHSKTDSFGRKLFDELQLSTGFISRQFSYLAGEVTEKHIEKEHGGRFCVLTKPLKISIKTSFFTSFHWERLALADRSFLF